MNLRICQHFRTKQMYGRDRGRDVIYRTPSALRFPYCWCNLTQTQLGPDAFPTSRLNCSKPSRPCFEPWDDQEQTGEALA